MRNSLLFLCFFGFFISTAAQQTIKGRVVNEVTGAPVAGSSVFISNTSKGTVSSSTGEFEINNVPAGKHKLIVSSIGYETNAYSFNNGQLPLNLKIELKVKTNELENVLLEPFVEEGWDKWGKTFFETLVGTTDNAAECKILNPEAVKFYFYKRSNRVKAYADVPILIQNNALGYNIKYKLEDFEIKLTDRVFLFFGYPLFEEMNSNKGMMKRWRHNRESAYNGSITHFMQSLYQNKLVQNGFEVRRAVRQSSAEKMRVESIYKGNKNNIEKGVLVIDNKNAFSTYPKDSVEYFMEVLRQIEYKEKVSKNILTADSLIKKTDGDNKLFYFPDYLYISFVNEAEEDAYARTIFPPRRSSTQLSYATLLHEDFITIDKAGNYFDPRNFSTSGYWSWSDKMSNSLPIEYTPGKTGL